MKTGAEINSSWVPGPPLLTTLLQGRWASPLHRWEMRVQVKQVTRLCGEAGFEPRLLDSMAYALSIRLHFFPAILGSEIKVPGH